MAEKSLKVLRSTTREELSEVFEHPVA